MNVGLFVVSWLLGLIDWCVQLVRYVPLRPKFFSKGYGDVNVYWNRLNHTLEQISNNEYLFLKDDDITWEKKVIEKNNESSSVRIEKGTFTSPLAADLPKEAQTSSFLLVSPNDDNYCLNDQDGKTFIIMLPATGEMQRGTRLNMAQHLAQSPYRFSSIILDAPFYGDRKPPNQVMFFLTTVQNILLQSQAIVEESSLLSQYLLRQQDKNTVVFTGFSYGAAMAAVASTFSSLLSSSSSSSTRRRMGAAIYAGSASPIVLADGVLENTVHYDQLRHDNDDSTTTKDAKKRLRQELAKTQLEFLAKNRNNDELEIGAVAGMSFAHDGFIRPRYSLELEDQIRRKSLKPNFRTTWIPGGHAIAALVRPWLQTKLVLDVVGELKGERRDNHGQKKTLSP